MSALGPKNHLNMFYLSIVGIGEGVVAPAFCSTLGLTAWCASSIVASETADELGLISIAIFLAFGISSDKSSNRLDTSWVAIAVNPVMLPFGRAMLATSPLWTGSL